MGRKSRIARADVYERQSKALESDLLFLRSRERKRAKPGLFFSMIPSPRSKDENQRTSQTNHPVKSFNGFNSPTPF